MANYNTYRIQKILISKFSQFLNIWTDATKSNICFAKHSWSASNCLPVLKNRVTNQKV